MVQTDPKPETQQTPEPNDAEIASRPRLAPAVVLAGEMQDGAYEQKQWLVQRDGQFVQLTELLYRVIEQVDGSRSLDEIAERVTGAIDRTVSADNVRQLLSAKLVPLGLVARADGSVVEQEAEDGAAARSPLQINMRVRALSPRLIRPFTAVLQKMFWPPVIIAMLVVAAAAQVYVFGIHGVASSVRDVLYHPALMFVVLALIIIGTVWHEFGHASALRYGGGEVRGMGVGIYLVYPAFYTDVTDNYRLPRWAKVRTDLGGFYFNLIFGALMVALFLLTNLAWLLLIVVLIDVEIIQQTLPFGRYDGYWTLADITGIPDFFSRIPGFVKSMLPFVKTKDDDFSRYKLWVRIVFAIYILIAAPLMAFIFFMMIKNAPRILGTAWDSAHTQLTTLNTMHARGDSLGMALAAAQLLILALPTFGMLYILFNLGRKGGKALWNYSKPTAARRVQGGAITLAAAAFLAYLWAPQLPFGGGRSGPLYATSSWKPIAPNERGTLADAGNSLGQVPVPYNPFHQQTPAGVTPPGGTAKTTPGVTPTPGKHAGAAKKSTPTPRPSTTPTGTVSPTTTPTLTPLPTVQATIAPSTPIPTIPATPYPTPIPTVPSTVTP